MRQEPQTSDRGPSLCARESLGGAPSGCRDAKALLVPLGPRWVVGRTEPQALGDSPWGGGAAPEPCDRVPVAPKPQPGFSAVHEEDLGQNCCPAPEATGSAPLQGQDTQACPPSLAPGR